ncbi:MAG: type II CAAX endopeptidase family protein [Patescibacteria group bacterium]
MVNFPLKRLIFSIILSFPLWIVLYAIFYILTLIFLILTKLNNPAIGLDIESFKNVLNPNSLAILTLLGFTQVLTYLLIVKFFFLNKFHLSWEKFGLTTENVKKQFVLALKLWVIAETGGLLLDFLTVKLGWAPYGPGGPQSPNNTQGPLLFIAFIFLGAVIAPLCEEIFFRGYIFKVLHSKYGFLIANVVSSLVFMSFHGISLTNSPAHFLLGVLFAASFYKTGLLIPVMVSHSLFNTTSMILNYFQVRLY